MSSKALISIIIAIIVIGSVALFAHSNSSTQPSNQPSATQTSPSQSSTPSSTSQTSSMTKSFTVNADDASADLTTISVKKGDPVSITFNVKPNNVYHGGLDFRSNQLDTGAIPPGSSKTITFTATNSFTFTPYWPSTNIAKPYTISVVVQ